MGRLVCFQSYSKALSLGKAAHTNLLPFPSEYSTPTSTTPCAPATTTWVAVPRISFGSASPASVGIRCGAPPFICQCCSGLRQTSSLLIRYAAAFQSPNWCSESVSEQATLSG
eukprot:GHVT01024544.1.p2 GENE.GHVT01024544.1~~GHVT01024544.1.p2  ORF type:complete len:113 (+),score=5.31 GHVT01024544.1:1771-2109(+)